MTVRRVEEALQDAIWPVLEKSGFSTFERRNSWRHSDQRIDVIHIEFFTKAMHRKWGTTPYSFALAAGFFLPFLPPFFRPTVAKNGVGLLVPDEATCHVRHTPAKQLVQKECKIPNIWYIDPEGNYLHAVVTDVTDVVLRDVVPWFARFRDLRQLLAMLLQDPNDKSAMNMCWGWGRMGSPVRLALTGFVALEMEDWTVAERCLRQVLDLGGLAALAGTKTIDDEILRGIELASAKQRGLTESK
jgi:hypothetical protein